MNLRANRRHGGVSTRSRALIEARYGGFGQTGRVRVLVVEDEAALADAVARGLRREGMAVDVAYDGVDGHEKATVTRYDVISLTGTCRACPATSCAGSWPPRGR